MRVFPLLSETRTAGTEGTEAMPPHKRARSCAHLSTLVWTLLHIRVVPRVTAGYEVRNCTGNRCFCLGDCIEQPKVALRYATWLVSDVRLKLSSLRQRARDTLRKALDGGPSA